MGVDGRSEWAGVRLPRRISRVRDGLKNCFGKELGNLLLNSQGQMM